MQAWWIPKECSDLLRDSIHFDREIKFLLDRCRVHKSFVSNKKIKMSIGKCEICGNEKNLNVHHIRPLWALSVEYICDSLIHGTRIRLLDKRDDVYTRWNSVTNLLTVCSECHTHIEKESDAKWKKSLSEKYHPHFCVSYSDARKNYGKFWNG